MTIKRISFILIIMAVFGLGFIQGGGLRKSYAQTNPNAKMDPNKYTDKYTGALTQGAPQTDPNNPFSLSTGERSATLKEGQTKTPRVGGASLSNYNAPTGTLNAEVAAFFNAPLSDDLRFDTGGPANPNCPKPPPPGCDCDIWYDMNNAAAKAANEEKAIIVNAELRYPPPKELYLNVCNNIDVNFQDLAKVFNPDIIQEILRSFAENTIRQQCEAAQNAALGWLQRNAIDPATNAVQQYFISPVNQALQPADLFFPFGDPRNIFPEITYGEPYKLSIPTQSPPKGAYNYPRVYLGNKQIFPTPAQVPAGVTPVTK